MSEFEAPPIDTQSGSHPIDTLPVSDTQNGSEIEQLGEEEFRINIENEIVKLTLNNAQIEAPDEKYNLDYDAADEKVGKSAENVLLVDAPQEKYHLDYDSGDEKVGKSAENVQLVDALQKKYHLDYDSGDEKVGKSAENAQLVDAPQKKYHLDYDSGDEKVGKSAENVEIVDAPKEKYDLDYEYEEKGKSLDTTENIELVGEDGWGIHKEEANEKWGTQETENLVDKGWGTEEVVVDDGWGNNNNYYTNDNVGYEELVVDYQSEEGDSSNVERLDNNNGTRRKTNYPMRPGAEDCTYYMKFGACKFGLNCKFNHPPRRKNQGMKETMKPRVENSERTGQTECKYHMTPGGCKFGDECKFNHGSDNSSISHTPELNFLGLPIRLGERECPYYMRTGSCKYGSSCRFHHPEPTTVGGSEPGHGNGGSHPQLQIHPSSWSSSPRAFSGTSSLPPVMYPATQGVGPPNPEWNSYQAGTYHTSERGLPTPPAFAMKNLPTQVKLPLPHHLCVVVDVYPERPGEPECSFFLKTGDCKYKSSCKFHHPKNHKPKQKSNSHSLSEKGLPLRPGQPICTHYHQYGICKYGPACKYDHPSNIGVAPAPFS